MRALVLVLVLALVLASTGCAITQARAFNRCPSKTAFAADVVGVVGSFGATLPLNVYEDRQGVRIAGTLALVGAMAAYMASLNKAQQGYCRRADGTLGGTLF